MAVNVADGPTKVLTQSVTEKDVAKYAGGGVVQFLIPVFGGAYTVGGLPPDLPAVSALTPYSKARDTILVSTMRIEGYWANAVHIAMSKLVSRGYQIQSPVPRRVEMMNDLLRWCDGRRGFERFLVRHLQDYYTCSNGAWVEIERVSRHPGARIVSIHHLDSLRVWRTGDPNIPAVYWDLRGGYHELKWWEVFNVTDFESPRAGFWWSGECASERSYKDIRAVAGMTQYFDEKIFGNGYTEIEFISGITETQLKDAMDASQSGKLAMGAVLFNGKLVVPVFSDVPITTAKVPLKGLPDDWKRQEELDIRLLNYANTLGIAPFELDPRLTARGAMGIGRQSQIIDENEQGRGSGAWEKAFLHSLNDLVAPQSTTVLMVTIDLRDDEMRAKNSLVRAQRRLTDIQAGVITAQQGLYIAIQEEDAPREFAQQSADMPEVLDSGEKPLTEAEQRTVASTVDMTKTQDLPNQGAAQGLVAGQPLKPKIQTSAERKQTATRNVDTKVAELRDKQVEDIMKPKSPSLLDLLLMAEYDAAFDWAKQAEHGGQHLPA